MVALCLRGPERSIDASSDGRLRALPVNHYCLITIGMPTSPLPQNPHTETLRTFGRWANARLISSHTEHRSGYDYCLEDNMNKKFIKGFETLNQEVVI